ncbi:MAG: excinuclease ABC subunit UvrC [Spirochaetia bacterium]
MNIQLQETIKNLPKKSGVYLMKDSNNKIIYVGKAVNLKNRVSSYFTGDKDPKTAVLVKRIDNIDTIITENEYEALLLENNLIKKHKPKYNINLKDGKSYPVIRITNEDFPRVFRTRRIIQDGSKYFGPFTDLKKTDQYLELIEQLFPIRKCRGKLKKRKHPCLYYHIGRCSAPCAGNISAQEYQYKIAGIIRLLEGKTTDLIRSLREKMTAETEKLNFEKAAYYRDTINAIRTVTLDQEVVNFSETTQDIIVLAKKEGLGVFSIFQIRDGKLSGRNTFRVPAVGENRDLYEQFILQYYRSIGEVPQEIILPIRFDWVMIREFFQNRGDKEPEMSLPRSKREQSLIKMAKENSFIDLDRALQKQNKDRSLKELKQVLSLPKLPSRIEGFDISHNVGKNTVASMVSFSKGLPDKSNYRYFKIKSLDSGQIDDFASIREAVARRYTRVINEKSELPDLIVIDGGKGQLSSAKNILKGIGLDDLPIIGLAKREEEIFLPDKKEPVIIPEGSPALQIIQHVRNEAHRFAITYTRKTRKKDLAFTSLERISGIGPKRSTALLKQFGSIQGIIDAEDGEIAKKTGISEELAKSVKKSLLEIRENTMNIPSDQ